MTQRLRLLVGFVNQGVISLGTLLMLVFAARGYSSEALGLFSVGVLTYQILIVIFRALTGETLIVLPRAGRREEKELAARCLQFAGTAPLALIVPGVFGLLLASGVWQVVCAALLIVPGLALQDALRHVYLRRKQVGVACAVDVLVVAAQLGIVWFGAGQDVPPWSLILLLGVPTFLIGYFRSFLDRAGVSVRGSREWRRSSRELGDGFVFEAGLGAFVQWLTLLSVAHFGSLPEAGAFRAVITIYGVTNVVTNFLRSHYLAQLAHGGELDRARMRRSTVEMVALTGGTVLFSYGVLELLPESLGEKLLGETWTLAVPYLLLGAINRFAAGLTSVPAVFLRVLRMPWDAARTRILISVVTLIAAPLSVAVGGATAAFVTMSIMSLVMVLALSRVIVRGRKKRE